MSGAPPENKPRRRLRTPAEVGARFGVSAATVTRWFDSGELLGADLSSTHTARERSRRRRLRFRDEDVDAFEQKRFVQAEN